jgi:tetratricopeptide (TPR) repeat protein
VAPSNLSPDEVRAGQDVLEFYKGVTLLVRNDERNPEAAEVIFQNLKRRSPNVGAYVVNEIAARVGVLLKDDIFGKIDGRSIQRAQAVLEESEELLRASTMLTATDRESLVLNQAVLRLALGHPDQALAFLPSSARENLNEKMQAFRAVALYRIGRPAEAQSALKVMEQNFGKTELLDAAWAQINEGAPYTGSVGVSSDEDPVVQVREAYRKLHFLDPIEQASVVSVKSDPLASFLLDQIRGASASIVSLVSVLKMAKIDDCEDDVTAVVGQLLLSRLAFLKWAVPDQSKGGKTPKGNRGERDLVIASDTTELTVIEAVICADPLRWKKVQDSLRRHFQKLLAYSTCRVFFHLTLAYDQDLQVVIDRLKGLAVDEAPSFLRNAVITDILYTDSRPPGFEARYEDGNGQVKVIFLVLDMGQENLDIAAAASAT